MLRTAIACVLVASCAQPVEQDGRDDSFTSGKSDTGGVAEGSADALAVLHVANTLDRGALVSDVGLSAQTADEIAKHRAGPDGMLGTGDDDPFDTLAELDAVPYVGPVAFKKLLAYAEAHGEITFGWRTDIRAPVIVNHVCSIDAPSDATDLRLLIDVEQSTSWRFYIRDDAGTVVQQITPPFAGWTDPIHGHHAEFQIVALGSIIPCDDFRGSAPALAYRVPVAASDPMACTTAGGWTSNPSTSNPNIVATAVVPALALFRELDAVTDRCAGNEVSLPWIPPTDGTYTFTTGGQHGLDLRLDGCTGQALSCTNQLYTANLVAGRPVVIGTYPTIPGNTFEWLDISRPRTEGDCHDGFDNDGDGKIDCADEDCKFACTPVEDCSNGIDDNGNGAIDCLDSQCATAAVCASNTCPGQDLGSVVGTSGHPVAGGNASDAPLDTFHSCTSGSVWQKSRFFHWTAPSAGRYAFRVVETAGSLVYNNAIRAYDTTCDADVLACGTPGSQSDAAVVLTVTAGQQVVLEVGASATTVTDPSEYQLEIFPY